MKTIAIEDLATVFASEFVKATTTLIYISGNTKHRVMFDDFLKMNYNRRKKLVEKILDKMLPNGNLLH